MKNLLTEIIFNMNVYRIYHKPNDLWHHVLADSIEKAIILFKKTRTNEVEKQIYKVEIVATNVIMETNRMSILEDRKQIKEFLMKVIPEQIEDFVDNYD